MDFSKFSNQDLLALKQGDYSKLSTGALIYLKNNSAGKGPDLQQLQAEDKPVQNVSLTPVTENDLNQAGESIATSKFGQQHPIAGAALGTAVAKAPDFIAAAQGVAQAPELAELAKNGGKALMDAGQSIGRKVGGIVDTLKGPTLEEAKALGQASEMAFQPEAAQKAGQYTKELVDPVHQQIRSLGQRLADLPGETADKLKILHGSLNSAGKEMGAAEDAAGFGFKSSPEFEQAVSNPKTMQKTLKAAADFAKAGPDKIAETVDPKTIQLVRKLSQEGGDGVSNLGNATLQQGREVAGKALGIIDKRFGQARSQYQEITDAINDLPKDQARMKSMLRSQLQAAKSKLAEAQGQTKDLMAAAKDADKARFSDIRQQSLDLLRKGVEHDRMVRHIKETLTGVAGVGATAFGIKKYKGM